MHFVFDMAALYLFFKVVIPIVAIGLIAYFVYRAVARPVDRHTFASTEPEDRHLDVNHDIDRLP